jgi:hypothetical protein
MAITAGFEAGYRRITAVSSAAQALTLDSRHPPLRKVLFQEGVENAS